MLTKPMLYWHAVKADENGECRLSHNDKRLVVVGETLEVLGFPRVCGWGLHACERLASCLNYSPSMDGNVYLCLVTLGGQVIDKRDKVVASKRRCVAMLPPAEVNRVLREFARKIALSVAHEWEASEPVRCFLEGKQYMSLDDRTLREIAWREVGSAIRKGPGLMQPNRRDHALYVIQRYIRMIGSDDELIFLFRCFFSDAISSAWTKPHNIWEGANISRDLSVSLEKDVIAAMGVDLESVTLP